MSTSRRPDSVGGRGSWAENTARHSAQIEDSVDSILEEAGNVVDFKGMRSRTLTDIAHAQSVEGGAATALYHPLSSYPSGSQSTIGSEASRSSARLVQTSGNPAQHGYPGRERLASPVWKPRSQRREFPTVAPRGGLVMSSFVTPGQQQQQHAMILTPPNTVLEYEDTDC